MKEKKQEPVNIDVSTAAAAEFWSKSEAARERKVAIEKRKADVEKSLLNKKQNRGAISAVGLDPEEMIKKEDSENKKLGSELDRAKSEIHTIFSGEQKQILATIADGWKEHYEQDSGPRKAQMENAIAQIKEIFASMAQFDDSSQAAAVKQSDDRVDAFNKRCNELGVGYKIPDANKLGTIIANDNKANADKIAKEISRFAEQFRKDTEAWKKKQS